MNEKCQVRIFSLKSVLNIWIKYTYTHMYTQGIDIHFK